VFEGIERIAFSKDWITLVILFVLTLVTIVKFYYNQRFTKLFSLLYSEKYYTDYLKTKPFLFNIFHLLLFIIFLINLSLLIYFCYQVLKPDDFYNEFFFFSQIVAITLLYIIIRYCVGYLLGVIFKVSEYQRHFTFLKISNLAMLSVLFLPLLIIISYSTISIHKFLVYFSLILLVILFLYRYFVMIQNERLNFNKLFYLFLYLCALEIAPIIVVYKMFVA